MAPAIAPPIIPLTALAPRDTTLLNVRPPFAFTERATPTRHGRALTDRRFLTRHTTGGSL
ncbi:hypothetical protein GCM10010517_67870 [Streptosporangium fragile]|uniref:Uncharacterized protein n=1 Tax=Streptosporangium fragile TaxID=46186 RepID=A0ABP6IPW7_9ACTN